MDVNGRVGNDKDLGIGTRFGAAWKALHEIGVAYGSNGKGLNNYKFKYPEKAVAQFVKLNTP